MSSPADGAPSLSQLAQILDLPLSQVLGAYLLGSRLWGSHRSASDYDMFLVVESLPKKAQGRRAGARFSTSISVRGISVDVLFATCSEFEARLDRARVPDMFCFLAPDDCKLLESQWLTTLKGKIVLEISSVVEEGQEASGEAWEQSQKLMRAGDFPKGKKVLGHSLRILALFAHISRQVRDAGGCLALRDVLVDIRSFNATHLELQSLFMRSWEEYEAKFGAQRHRLLLSLAGDDGLHEDQGCAWNATEIDGCMPELGDCNCSRDDLSAEAAQLTPVDVPQVLQGISQGMEVPQ